MKRTITMEDIQRWIDQLHENAIRERSKGLFDGANWWAELAHQLENLNWFGIPEEFPGLWSTVMDELVRFYGRPA